MTLSPCSGDSAAAWITSSDRPWHRLVTYGPAGLDAYARLRFLPDPLYHDPPEVTLGADAPSEHELLRVTLDVLGQHTRTPDDVYYCIWDGWGSDTVPASVVPSPKVEIPHRSYFLWHGTLSDFGEWDLGDVVPGHARSPWPDPALIWPADHAWCIANDVDPHFAGIGASSDAVADLLAHSGLDVVTADPSGEQPYFD